MDIEHERPEFYEALGRTIQVLRTDQSLDRKDLADRCGISYSYLAAIENGKKPPSSKVLFAIAGALGLLSHELLASVETRFRRQQHLLSAPPRPTSPPLRPARPGSTPTRRPVPGSPHHAPTPIGPGPHSSPRPLVPPDRPRPRSPTPPPGSSWKLERLNLHLSDEDRDLVLGLARRLAGEE